MLVLGIESSCDETAAAVVRDGTVLSNVISSQVPVHARYGGVVPELASRNHLMAMLPVIREALDKAGVELKQLDRVAVTWGPGLMGALLMGVQAAKTIAITHQIPLVGVHHVEGHITAVMLEDGDQSDQPLEFPYVALAVSGGHSSIYLVKEPGVYGRVGCTLDDAAGEAFDKVARLMDLPYPGGVSIDKLSKQGNPQAYDFPRAMPQKKNFSFSFSGLKTAVRTKIEELLPLTEQTRADLAASFQEAVVDSLVSKTTQAALHHQVRHVVISGGVAANSRLREKFKSACLNQNLVLHSTRMAYCTDNAAMIAGAGQRGTPLDPAEVLKFEPFASRELGDPIDE